MMDGISRLGDFNHSATIKNLFNITTSLDDNKLKLRMMNPFLFAIITDQTKRLTHRVSQKRKNQSKV